MLRDRIANTLGWSVKDTYQFSLPTLAALLRQDAPDLTKEIEDLVRTGQHVYGKRRSR